MHKSRLGHITALLAAGVLLVALVAPTAASATDSYSQVGTLAVSTHGLAVDASDNLWVAYSTGPLVREYDPSLNLLTQWAGPNSANGLALGSGNTVYVASSSFPSPIKKYDQAGNLLNQFGPALSTFQIALDPSGNVYVTDGSAYVKKYDSAGNYLGAFTGFSLPRGIAYDPTTGSIWVADMAANLIRKYSQSGTLLAQWGGVTSPSYGLAVDSQGNIYVGEYNSGLIKKFDPSGTLLAQWAGVVNPCALAVDSGGSVYAAGDSGGSIKKYRFCNTSVNTPESVTLSGGVRLSYDRVTAAGNTTATAIVPSGAPSGYTFLPAGFDVTTDATYDTTGGKSVYVTLPYAYSGNASQLKVFHYVGGTWVDSTYSIDTNAHTITAKVGSLSPFAIGSSSGGGSATNTPASSDWSLALMALAGLGLAAWGVRTARVAARG